LLLLSLVRHRQVGIPRDRQDTRDFEQRDSLGTSDKQVVLGSISPQVTAQE